jgi:hypothetical protein
LTADGGEYLIVSETLERGVRMARNSLIPSKKAPFKTTNVGGAKFTLGAEVANVRKVTIQLRGQRMRSLGVRGVVYAYLSDDTNGDSLAAAAPSGGWAIAVNGLLIPEVANKSATFVSEANGLIDVNITEVGVKSFFLILVLPDGSVISSGAIAFA